MPRLQKQQGSIAMPPQKPWEQIASIIAAAVVLFLVVFLVIRNKPFADPNLVILTRIILGLAVSVFGATVPGFLNVGWSLKGLTVRAGGALALCVLSLVVTPQVVQTSSDPDNLSQEHYTQGANAYNMGHYADAVAHLSQVQSNSALYRTALGLKGGAFFQMGRYDDALTTYIEARRVSKDRREQLQADYDIGLTYLNSKNYREAREKLVPLSESTEMQNDPAVIYNTAAVLNSLNEIDLSRSIFNRFPLATRVPADDSSRDIYAKAHWLTADLNAKKSELDCKKINSEITAALAIAPYLKGEIDNDKDLNKCKKH